MADLRDDELKAIQDELNKYEPKDIRLALDGKHPLRGAEARTDSIASGPLDFGSVQPGVLIYRLEPGRVHIRITDAEMTGAFYDDLEVPDASVRALASALAATLENRHAPKDH
ncbi:MAG: hypothetical protein ABSC94_00840 [Polyangiaceae bacterium]|jgi:hypothetical protein